MPRHACGFALADQGADTRLIQDYLGHTVKYTATNLRKVVAIKARRDLLQALAKPLITGLQHRCPSAAFLVS
jgi:integrase